MNLGRTRALQSAKYLEIKRRKNIISAVIICTCILLISILCVFILRSPVMQISTVEFRGLSTLQTEDLREQVLKTFNGYYFSVIPKSNILFYSKNTIETILTDSFKKIKSLAVVSKNLSSIEIAITERQRSAIVCDGFKDDTKDCFFSDSYAYVYDTVEDTPDEIYIKYYLNSDSNTLSIGTKFIDSNTFMNLQNFVKTIQTAGVSANGILINNDGSYELYIKNNDQSITVAYFDDRTSLDTISSNLIAFWKSNSNKIYEYINLRFGNNIFSSDKKVVD